MILQQDTVSDAPEFTHTIPGRSEKDMALKKIVAFTAILTLVGACTSIMGVMKLYEGPEQPDSAIAKIHVPEDVDLVRVDEKSVSKPLLAGDNTELHVLPGVHRITLRYGGIWDIDDGYHTKVRSDPVTKSLATYAGHVYRVEYDSPENLQSARAYARNFDYWIRDAGAASGNEPSELVGDEPVRFSNAGVVHTQTVAQPNTAGNLTGVTTNEAVTGPSQGDAGAQPPLEQLKYWWGQANDADRKSFRLWSEKR